MAEVSFIREKLDEELQCGVCLDQYVEPRIFSCHHSFCLECVKNLPRKRQTNRRYQVSCPVCCKDILLPRGGPDKLPSDFRINRLLDLQKESDSYSTVTATDNDGVSYCDTHTDEELKVYCKTCKDVICLECTIGKSHQNHNYQLISECFPEEFKEITLGLKLVKERVSGMARAVELFEKTESQLVAQEESIQKEIHSFAENFILWIQDSERRLQKELETIVQRKKKIIHRQKNIAQTCLERLRSCQLNVEKILEYRTVNHVHILQRKGETMNEINGATKQKPSMLAPLEKANIVFTREETVKYVWSDIGTINGNEFGHINFEPRAKTSLAGKVVTGTISLVTKDRLPFTLSPLPISCSVVPPDNSPPYAVKCSAIQGKTTGWYDITFTPKVRGEHSLEIQIGGLNVCLNDDPWSVFNVAPTPQMIGKPIDSLRFEGALDVAICDNGNMVVLEKGVPPRCSCILVYEKTTYSVMKMPIQLYNPQCVAISKFGHILVTDEHRLQMFSIDGRKIASVGNYMYRASNEKNSLFRPMGVAVSKKSGKIYVADSGNNRIQVFQNNLAYCQTINRYGVLSGFLNQPSGITVDDEGNLYISQLSDNCVLKLNSTGWFIAKIGSDSFPMLKKPSSLATASGYLYIADEGYQRILVFDTAGKYVCRLSETLVLKPTGITLDILGNLYITNFPSGRVLKY